MPEEFLAFCWKHAPCDRSRLLPTTSAVRVTFFRNAGVIVACIISIGPRCQADHGSLASIMHQTGVARIAAGAASAASKDPVPPPKAIAIPFPERLVHIHGVELHTMKIHTTV